MYTEKNLSINKVQLRAKITNHDKKEIEKNEPRKKKKKDKKLSSSSQNKRGRRMTSNSTHEKPTKNQTSLLINVKLHLGQFAL